MNYDAIDDINLFSFNHHFHAHRSVQDDLQQVEAGVFVQPDASEVNC